MGRTARIAWLVLGLLVVVASPGHVAAAGSSMPAVDKTLVDFLRAYSGTKPIVAIQKYQEYLARRKADVRSNPQHGSASNR